MSPWSSSRLAPARAQQLQRTCGVQLEIARSRNEAEKKPRLVWQMSRRMYRTWIRDWWAASGSQTVTGAATPVAPLLLAAVTGVEGSNYDPAFHLRMLPSINLSSATSIAAVATPASLSASAISSSPLLLAWLLVPHGVASGRQGISQKQC